jgi:HEAT repeat protein
LEDRQQTYYGLAVRGFQILGPAGKSAIGDLELLLEDGKKNKAWADTLAIFFRVGEDAVPSLMGVVRDERKPVPLRCDAALEVGALNRRQILYHTGFVSASDCHEAIVFVAGVMTNCSDPTISRETLIRTLACLAGSGTNSSSAAVVIAQFLTDPSEDVRCAATNSLERIAAEMRTNGVSGR